MLGGYEDLEPLSARILERLAARMGRPRPRLKRAQLAQLRAYRWPGNVRELENVLERSLLLSPEGAAIELDLPRSRAGGRVSTRGSTDGSFDEGSRQCISDALVASGGRIYGSNGAAALLGLKPTTLVSKMERLGMRRRAS